MEGLLTSGTQQELCLCDGVPWVHRTWVWSDLELKLYQNYMKEMLTTYKLVGPWMGCTGSSMVLRYISKEGPKLLWWAVWVQDVCFGLGAGRVKGIHVGVYRCLANTFFVQTDFENCMLIISDFWICILLFVFGNLDIETFKLQYANFSQGFVMNLAFAGSLGDS